MYVTNDYIVNLNNINFINCVNNEDEGGAITSHEGNIYINNCTFTKNKASGDGATIYQIYGTTNIDNSKFYSNLGGRAIKGHMNNITIKKFNNR